MTSSERALVDAVGALNRAEEDYRLGINVEQRIVALRAVEAAKAAIVEAARVWAPARLAELPTWPDYDIMDTPLGACPFRCHEIGGPWIAENPQCPVHGGRD